MTDDPFDEQVAAQLGRRAASANLSRDWSRRILLPAVTSGIDSRPQPVVTSRWSAFAGLTAVVAMLVVLVVAIPRLNPAPSVADQTSSPGASASSLTPRNAPLQVMSAQEFAVAVQGGRLRSSTLLVEGAIGPRPIGGEPNCHVSPPQACKMGRLEDTDPSLDVLSRWLATDERDPMVRDGGGMWPWWHLPSGPITGTLVLSVGADGTIEFVGRVDPAGDARPMSVADAVNLGFVTVDLDEAVLVEGWLWSGEAAPYGPRTVNIDCFDPEPTPIPGLPNYYCQPRDAVVDYLLNTADSVTAPEPRLVVQRGAAGTFGGVTGVDPHVFALSPRLHGGGCTDAQPCWQWEVIGRLSEPPVAPATTRLLRDQLACGPTKSPDVHANQPSATWTGFALDDQTGLVERCEAWEFQPADASRMTVTNPNGDLRVLELTWAEACASYAKVTFIELLSGFEIVPTSTMPDNSACDGVVYSRGLRLYLNQPVTADTVSTRVIYTPAVTPRPTPAATPQVAPGPAWWELAPSERPTDASTELDVVIFERECANGENPEGRVVGPEVEYGELAVTITFQVRPLPGGGDCQAGPGAPVTVELSEPLGDRRIVDGGFASSDRVIQHGDGLLWVAPLRSLERATARLVALLGPNACRETMTQPRAVDEAQLEQLANDLGTREGMLGDRLAWVGDVESAVRELGGFELYQDGRDRAWYMLGFAEQQEWLAEGIEPGDLVLADVSSVVISDGRTIWIPGRHHQTFGSPDCAWDSDATSALGPRADQQDLGFTVSISAPSASWTVGQSLEGFGAALEYSGAQDPIDIVGSGSGFTFAYWTRLDGAPGTPPLAMTADCRPYQFAAGERRAIGMWPTGGFAHNGLLTLPPGIWRLTAFTAFTIRECGGQEVGLSASIIVRVR